MEGWDPEVAPVPEAWLALDDDARKALIAGWHREHPSPALHGRTYNENLHHTWHAIVETQIAAGEPVAVAETVARLVEAGLTRHAALHAVMRVAIEDMVAMMQEGRLFDEERHATRLRRIRPEDAIVVQNLGESADDDEPPPPRNREERRAAKKGRGPTR